MSMVCCFGAWDEGYPRNRILRAGWVQAGYTVVEARVRGARAWRRWPALAAAWSRVASFTDLILVPGFRHNDMPLACLLKANGPRVFDPLVSRWDTPVEDRRLDASGSGQARWNRVIDRGMFRAAAVLLGDTWTHGELFEELGAERSRLRRVPVGAEPEIIIVAPPPVEGAMRISYGWVPAAARGTHPARSRCAARGTRRDAGGIRGATSGRRHGV